MTDDTTWGPLVCPKCGYARLGATYHVGGPMDDRTPRRKIVKPLKDVLWVEVGNDSVTPRTGPEMPKEKASVLSLLFYDRACFTRKEFARWSGLTFPKGSGVYGLQVKLAVIQRMREVVETEYVVAKKTTTRLVADG